MTKEEFNSKYWMFYLKLEKDFCNTLDFVEFSQNNYGVYSKEYVRQLLSIGSELDITFKALCNQIGSNATVKCITDYANILCGWEDFVNSEVCFKLTKEYYAPFCGWTSVNSPKWWKAYNKVKHNRVEEENFKKGNLKNVFLALMALFVIDRYIYRNISAGTAVTEPEIKSSLFDMKGWNICIPEGNGWVRVLDVSTGCMNFVNETS